MIHCRNGVLLRFSKDYYSSNPYFSALNLAELKLQTSSMQYGAGTTLDQFF